MEEKVLYQIKNLDRIVFRCIFNGNDIEDNRCIRNMKIPTQTQMQIISYIIKHQNEEVYQKDLEEVLNLRRATVSGVLHTMEKNNLIKKWEGKKKERSGWNGLESSEYGTCGQVSKFGTLLIAL